MNYHRADLLDRLASEYVLGTLHGAARRRFDKVLAESSAARAAVHAWEQRLAVLAASVPPVAPPPRVWAATEALIASTVAGSGTRLAAFLVGESLEAGARLRIRRDADDRARASDAGRFRFAR